LGEDQGLGLPISTTGVIARRLFTAATTSRDERGSRYDNGYKQNECCPFHAASSHPLTDPTGFIHYLRMIFHETVLCHDLRQDGLACRS